MTPQVLANNVIFTIGKLAHNNKKNSESLVESGALACVMHALELYGLEKISLTGNGLYAIGALLQQCPTMACQRLSSSVKACELFVSLLSAHAVYDLSVAVHGLLALEAICNSNTITTSSSSSSIVITQLLTKHVDCIGVLLLHILRSYVRDSFSCNVEIASRVVVVLSSLMRVATTTSSTNSSCDASRFKQNMLDAGAVNTLQTLILDNISIMDKTTNSLANEIINKCNK